MIGEMIGAGIGAATNLIGGAMNRKEAAATREAQERMNAANIALQREFAQTGIQWKVEDAKKAGIHPIYALGGQTASFSPVSSNFSADTSMGNAMAAAGQDISRAMQATRTEGDRVDAFTKTMQALQLENQSLQNDNLRTEIASKTARLRQTPNPPFPAAVDRYLIPGQANSGIKPSIEDKALERVAPAPGAPDQEPGAIVDKGFARTSTGLAPVPSKDVKERIEDNIIQELMWAIRNNVVPTFFPSSGAPNVPARKGQWRFNPFTQQYEDVVLPRGPGELWRDLKRYRDWRQYGKRY